jgi:formylglycine-generating enzyme required for sulfatase activity
VNPPGPASGTTRALRSGTWSLNTSFLRVAYRTYYNASYEWAHLGIRCAR